MSQMVDEHGTLIGTANPFPGLRPFQIDESHLFFGREGQSDEVLLKLSKSRFVGVIGPSGSGKSSFIYCGVLPILYGGFLTDASPNWEVVVTRPGAGPIDNLAESLLKTVKDYNTADGEDKKIKRTIVSTLLRSSSLGLVEAIQQSRRKEDINYLILVDQFEELFRFKDSTDPNSVNESLAFINLLMEAVNYEDAPIYVAITMRSDFIGECAQFPELTRKINDSHYLIPQMTRDQKRRAIEGPVAVGNAKITPRLTQQLLNDLGDNPDQLPILQHALMRTWSYWARYRDYEAEPVDLKHYEAIGTMAEALSMHANEAYDELDEEQQRICEILFKAITEKRGENFGIRRPTRLNEIASIADVAEGDVVAVIEKFREPGRSLLTPAFGIELGSKSMIDISHESLMRIWVRLKNWVDDESEAVQMYLRLAEAASQYQVGKAGLWRPPDLQLALNWQAKHKPTLVWGQRYHPAFERTMIFLEYSKKEFDTEQRIKELEAKRKLQRARITAIVFGSLAAIALVAFVYAYIQQAEAKRQEQNAKDNLVIAERNEAEANRLAKIAKEEKEAADAARKVAEAAQEAEAKQRELAQENERKAKEQEAEALRQKGFAEANERTAIANEKLAKENEDKANIARADATKRRYVAQAKAMALQSLTLSSDLQLEALLAQQAYIFNTNNEGYEFDTDIYNGLYFALKNKTDKEGKPNPHPLTASLKGHDFGAARSLVTHGKDEHIYSGGSDGKIIRWTYLNNSWQGETLVDKVRRPNYQVYSMAISPDETKLVAAGLYTLDDRNNYIEVYDLTKMKAEPKKITGFTYNIEDVEFTPDGKGLFARDNGGMSIKLADFNSATEVIKAPVKINAIDLSKDGKRLAGAGDNGTLYIWDIANNYAVTEVKNLGRSLTAVTWHPSENQVIIGNESGLLRIVRNGILVRNLPGHDGPIEKIIYNHAGSFFATASKDRSVRIWNVNRLTEPPIRLFDHSDWIWSLTFSPNDEQLMVGLQSSSQRVRLGAIQNEESIRSYPTKISTMANVLCNEFIERNMTPDEWATYVGKDLNYETTCKNFKSGAN
ncbi:MAG: High-affnity carbon uptake protein Hat/HatR [Cyclobacteriaceae bacterium]|nr:High-affnity carbon uptake protein Hat/HatR [Cyclobacteriaceae bacterium]